jgi:hypothetical protein
MRGVPVRVRVVSPGVEMRDARGRMGRETRGTIIRKKGKRGSIRLMTVVGVAHLGARLGLGNVSAVSRRWPEPAERVRLDSHQSDVSPAPLRSQPSTCLSSEPT